MKTALDEIFKIASRERDAGSIDIVDFNYVKNSLCDIVTYYELPSKTCGTEENPDAIVNQPSGSGGKSILSKVIKVVLIVVGILAVAFIILIVLFALKARKQKQLTEDDDTTNDTPLPKEDVKVAPVSQSRVQTVTAPNTDTVEPNTYAKEEPVDPTPAEKNIDAPGSTTEGKSSV